MFVSSFDWPHILVIVVFLALEVVAIVQVWRDERRTTTVKVVWTVIIIVIPVIGVVGWLVNWLLARATDALGKRAV